MSEQGQELSEIALQAEILTDIWNYYPDYRGRCFTITNNSESREKGSLNMAMGVVKGLSDTCWLLPDGRCLWIEMKLPGKTQSDQQKWWQGVVESLGHLYLIAYSRADYFRYIGLEDPRNFPGYK